MISTKNKKMTSIKVENNIDFLPLSTKKEDHLQLSYYKIENRENIKNASETIKIEKDLRENQTSLHGVNNKKQEICGNQKISLNNVPFLESKIIPTSSNNSDECIKEVNKDVTETAKDFFDSSKIYISCRFCKKGFETIKVFNIHDCRKKKSTSKIKMHKCKFCSLTFSQKYHLITHIKGHKRNDCTLCNAQFTKRKALCKHLRTVHNVKESEKLYKCSFCDKHFSKRLSLNFHLKSHTNNQFVCVTCCFMCDDEDTYNDHVKQHVKIHKHECHLCQKKFVRRQQYDQHMMAHERYLCASCNITFPNKKLYLKHQHSVHQTQNEKKYECLICQKLFVRRKYLELHQKVHTGEKPVNCSHCKKSFSDCKSLLKHMTTVKHLQRVSNEKDKIIEIEKSFLCSKCGIRFYRQQSLLRHVEIIHSATEFLKCHHCDYKTKCKTNFKRHLELHTDAKRFICELCGSSFRALATLKEHYVFVHSENREFICEVCKKGFKNKSTLQRHMRIHNENRPYKCFCNRDYKRMSHLKRHMVSAHQMTINAQRNQIPMLMKENANLNSLLEQLPDESSCDDFSVPLYITTVPSHQAKVHEDFPDIYNIPAISSNHAETSLDLSINENSCEKQLPAEIKDDAVPLNSMQKFLDNCDAYIIAKDSENTSSTFNLSQQLKLPPVNMLSNSETSSTSLDDATLSLSPSNYCNASSPLNTISIESVTTLSHSISSQDVNSLTPIDNLIHSQTSPNLNFQTPISNIDSFVSFVNSDSPISLSKPPFSLNSSPSHATDLNLEQYHCQRQLFGVSEDFLTLPSYATRNEFEANCSPNQFFSWDTDENSNTLEICNNDLATTSTCANIFSSSLTYNVNNILPNNLFANDSIDVTALKSEFDSLSNFN